MKTIWTINHTARATQARVQASPAELVQLWNHSLRQSIRMSCRASLSHRPNTDSC